MEPKNLKSITNFLSLKCGAKVFSKIYGLGEFDRLYNNEAIVQFSDRRIRIAPDDTDSPLYLVEIKKRRRGKRVNPANSRKAGSKVTDKESETAPVYEYITLKDAAYVFSLRKKGFIQLCEENSIKIDEFGITKKELLKLRDIVFKK